MTAALLALLLAQTTWKEQGILVNDESVQQGYAKSVNCTGAGVTCSSTGYVWTINATGGSGGAPTTATYITQTPDATLSAEQALSGLASGLLTNTTGTGVVSIYGGATCTAPNFVQTLSSTGVPSCATPAGVPAGLDMQVQFNDSGVFGGDAGMTYSKSADTLVVAGTIQTPNLGIYNPAVGPGTVVLWLTRFGSGADVNAPLGDLTLRASGGTVNVQGNSATATTAGALTTDPSDCTAGQYATTIAANGNLTCAQVAYSQVSGTPTIPPDVSGAPIVTTAADATLTNEKVLPTCAGTDKLTFNGTTISCATDQTGGGAGNFVEVDVDFGGPAAASDASTVVTGQAWVTAGVDPHRQALQHRVASTGFTVTVTPANHTTGVYKIHCAGG